jgi:hypothetical protein
MIKADRLIAIAVIALIFGSIYWWIQSGNFHEWKEEVKLADGRTIVVDQKRRFEGRTVREAWVSFTIPGISDKPLVWHESLNPLVLNVNDGKLYVVAYPASKAELAKYGNPAQGYVSFQWVNGAWKQIRFQDVPAAIYQTNMLIWPVPNNESRLLTVAEKDGPDYNGNAKVQAELKRLAP